MISEIQFPYAIYSWQLPYNYKKAMVKWLISKFVKKNMSINMIMLHNEEKYDLLKLADEKDKNFEYISHRK